MTRSPVPIPVPPWDRVSDVPVGGMMALVDEGPAGFGIVVTDVDGGGVWHPDEDACVDIRRHRDPARAAVELCQRSPMRGRWSL